MATILPFPSPRGGDWTAQERARLDELAATFAGEAGVEIAFGRTDAGDPWCVVLDARDEVLVHIAREAGSFVAHSADDVFVRSADLRTAVERILGSRWQEERSDVVVPFAAGGRSAQVVTAVLVVASFVHHYRAEAQPAEDWSFAAARPLKPGMPRESRDEAAKAAAAIDATPLADIAAAIPVAAVAVDAPATAFATPQEIWGGIGVPEPAEAAAGESPGAALALRLVEASAGITGSLEAEVLIGGDGDDILDARTAPAGSHDLVDGQGGDDRLILDQGTIAIGGPGSDIFAIRAPEAPSPVSLLGVLVDFDPGTDLIATVGTNGGSPSITVVATTPMPDIFTDPGVNLAAPAPALPGNRMTLDLDGDGQPDGYVLVNGGIPDRTTIEALHELFTPATPPSTAPVLPADAPLAPVEIDMLHALLPELI